MLQNIIGGIQGIVDHTMVGHYVGYTGNAAIGVSWQIFLVVIVFISSLFTGMSILVARFTGQDDHEKVNRTVYQAFLTALFLSLGILAPIGYVLTPELEAKLTQSILITRGDPTKVLQHPIALLLLAMGPMVGIPIVLGVFMGVSTATRWSTVLQFWNRTPFGSTLLGSVGRSRWA